MGNQGNVLILGVISVHVYLYLAMGNEGNVLILGVISVQR